ncbi:MAG: hypothetical protein IT557_17765 [Alphaproteobacteria bacterium]|nr:hypothetical protein [Alphaproteobacteria bacterium]
MIRLVLIGLVLAAVWWFWQRLQSPAAPSAGNDALPGPDAEAKAAESATEDAAARAEASAEAADLFECPVCQQLVPLGPTGVPAGGCGRADCPWPEAEEPQPDASGTGSRDAGPSAPRQG